ncbi:hypothetical protein HDV03_001298 [Kappamyces sp. JEL0829]|nr:hypothetical protein HDV03_001298 [Kappamyces sp. JEL0829]
MLHLIPELDIATLKEIVEKQAAIIEMLEIKLGEQELARNCEPLRAPDLGRDASGVAGQAFQRTEAANPRLAAAGESQSAPQEPQLSHSGAHGASESVEPQGRATDGRPELLSGCMESGNDDSWQVVSQRAEARYFRLLHQKSDIEWKLMHQRCQSTLKIKELEHSVQSLTKLLFESERELEKSLRTIALLQESNEALVHKSHVHLEHHKLADNELVDLLSAVESRLNLVTIELSVAQDSLSSAVKDRDQKSTDLAEVSKTLKSLEETHSALGRSHTSLKDELSLCRNSHSREIEKLQSCIARLGGEAADGCGDHLEK